MSEKPKAPEGELDAREERIRRLGNLAVFDAFVIFDEPIKATPPPPRVHRELCFCGSCKAAKRKAFEARGKKS